MLSSQVLGAVLMFASSALAHIAPTFPPPFRAAYNPNSVSANIDYSITSPLDGSGSNFPCKGYQTDMGSAGGESVVTWSQGAAANMTTGSGATHGGGSCQLALSYDKGVTFNVIHSYIGSCPISAGQTFDFTIPADAPTGAAMFSWTWFNMIGNREIYMDCASVTIAGSTTKTRDAPAVAFSNRPSLFLANLNNGCNTIESTEVVFPDPGPDVTDKRTTQAEDTISGTCAAVKGIGGGSGSGSSSGSSPESSSAASAPAAESSQAQTNTGVFTVPSVSTTSASSAAAVTSASDGGVFVTVATPSPSGAVNATATSTAAASTIAAASTTVSGGASPVSTGTGSAFSAGAKCTQEGEWNCVNGTSYQQCASGAWSVVQPLAAGTSCTPGESAKIDITRRVKRGPRARPVRRYLQKHH